MGEETRIYLIDEIIQHVKDIESQFRRLEAIIAELQTQRDQYKALYEGLLNG